MSGFWDWFTVTGEASAVSADEQQLSTQAVEEYLAYVRSQASELLPLVPGLMRGV